MEGIDTKQRGFNFKVKDASGSQGGTSFEDLGYQPFSETEDYAIGDVVIYEGALYKFTSAHSASAWIGTDAVLTSVEELIRESGSQPLMVETTYTALKALRDGGNLVPGTWYRITDYTCTTAQYDTQSAGHVFDIIVMALDESTLSEDAKAIQHEGDTYFANSRLQDWKLRYRLDNDFANFEWADANGKGVIYRMIDEWGNDCPYDFKNIMFKRYLMYSDDYHCLIFDDEGTEKWCYTFNYADEGDLSEDCSDASLGLNGDEYNFYRRYEFMYNVIEPYTSDGESSGAYLNDIVLLSTQSFTNVSNPKRGYLCLYNRFEKNCHKISVGYEAETLKITNGYNIVLNGMAFVGCEIGDNCNEIVLGSKSSGNYATFNIGSNCCGINIVKGNSPHITLDSNTVEVSFDLSFQRVNTKITILSGEYGGRTMPAVENIKQYIGIDSSGNVRTWNMADLAANNL